MASIGSQRKSSLDRFAAAGCGEGSDTAWADKSHENRGLFPSFRKGLLVYHRPQHGDSEMRELRCAFVQLQPPHRAVLLQITRNAEFGDDQVFRHPRFKQAAVFAPTPATQQIADANVQRLAGLDVI